MTVNFISVFDRGPEIKGWYATLHCWEVQEGFFPGSAFWNGEKFTNDLPISNWVDNVFLSKEEAGEYAVKNDPNW